MELKTYRAATMHEALAMVRRELGPDAAVLHTREVRARRLFGCLPGPRQIEVTASCDVNVPSRLPPRDRASLVAGRPTASHWRRTARSTWACRSRTADRTPALPGPVQGQLSDLQAMVKELCRRSQAGGRQELPEELFRLFTDLLDADLSEELARELVERVRTESHGAEAERPGAGEGPHRADDRGGDPRGRADPGDARHAGGWWPWSGRPAWARRPPSPSWPPTTGSRRNAAWA